MSPRLHFRFHTFAVDGNPLVLLEIPSAYGKPTTFEGRELIRIGSNKKPLKDFPEQERALWRVFDQTPFEELSAASNLDAAEALALLDYLRTSSCWDCPCPRTRTSFMRRVGICEERGSGVDKVVSETELFQLPPPRWERPVGSLRVVLFAHRALKDMDRQERVYACYLHACLRYVLRDPMTNTTLRERFGIDAKNSAMASRIIRDAKEAEVIKPYEEGQSNKTSRYLPYWA